MTIFCYHVSSRKPITLKQLSKLHLSYLIQKHEIHHCKYSVLTTWREMKTNDLKKKDWLVDEFENQ